MKYQDIHYFVAGGGAMTDYAGASSTATTVWAGEGYSAFASATATRDELVIAFMDSDNNKKYSFTLGKSYINEALKNADRIHAISFGKFYLDAYGSTAKWEDLKEAFQYWNINSESSFSKLDTNQYDPKFIELVVELSKIISSRTDKK